MKRPTVSFTVEVDCVAGGRGEETPRAVRFSGLRHEVAEVIDRWYDAGRRPTDPVRRIFKVRLDSGDVVFLEQDETHRAWAMRAPLRIRME